MKLQESFSDWKTHKSFVQMPSKQVVWALLQPQQNLNPKLLLDTSFGNFFWLSLYSCSLEPYLESTNVRYLAPLILIRRCRWGEINVKLVNLIYHSLLTKNKLFIDHWFSVGSSYLQIGQVLFSLSQGVKQSGWNTCPQGRNIALVPKVKLSWHTVQTGVSSSWLPSFFLQWHSWIGITGILLSASFLVGFFFC